VNRLSWNEYPVMAAVAAIAGIVLFLLLQTLGGGPAGEQPLKRAEPASSPATAPPTPSQVEALRQERERRRAILQRRARAHRAHRAAAAAAAPAPAVRRASPATGTTGSYGAQPDYRQQQQTTTRQQPSTPAPQPKSTPAPQPKQQQPKPKLGRTFDDAG